MNFRTIDLCSMLICNFYQIGLIQYEFSVLAYSAHAVGVDNIDLKSKGRQRRWEKDR